MKVNGHIHLLAVIIPEKKSVHYSVDRKLIEPLPFGI
jgi:hypothetical protein